MSERPADPAPRRRASAVVRRLGLLEVLALVLPLLTVGALALVRPLEDGSTTRPPTEVPLTRATLVCPPELAGRTPTRTVALANADGTRGDLTLRVPEEGTIPLGGVVRRGRSQAVAGTADGEVAAGLVGTRFGAGAAVACGSPQPEQWFTGVGGAPEHSSVLTLVNPDGGPAVADVTVLGPDGPVDVPDLRGVTVPGGRTTSLDLATVVPTRDELALHVVVSRGRLGVSVEDTVDGLDRGTRSTDWLSPQAEPAETSYLLGLGGKPGNRALVVANPGTDEVRVGLRIVSRESEFAPAGAPDLRVAPGTTQTVDLTRLLAGRATRGATGLRLAATGPVTATLRTFAAGDLSHAVTGSVVTGRAAVAVPDGPSRLVLGGVSDVGVGTWTSYDASGEELDSQRVELDPGVSERIKLPGRSALLVLELARTTAVASLETGPPGLSVLPLTPLVEDALVPDVRPALR